MVRIIRNFILAMTMGLLLPIYAHAQDDQLMVVANGASIPAEMDMAQLQSILKGEKLRWNDGTRVSIALMKTNTPIGMNTCDKLYNMSGNDLNKYFLALVFQGKVKAPTFFNTTSELEAYVAQTPGAIGVVPKAKDPLLKIITIDGKQQI
ncbi:MAG: hypothetical protein MUO53_03510 [Maribacter sp.]|nr:hypothetical protein [Maribacter sp.]